MSPVAVGSVAPPILVNQKLMAARGMMDLVNLCGGR
ncbi:hypothetical protein SKA53_02741 [Yoonia vestfoldensis SKA53]|uniref:Uncharacterized protein n=1 Tax=Yoonia vestfoldensis SKA53 TaxID=314232 RepID=A3V471_9RHOB|nr:hypothetical protein SKA53_02741 [Yoonia vestfoldensis SKA53]